MNQWLERPPHYPPRINLDVDDVVNYHLEFLVDKVWVDKIGFTKVIQASFSLKFIDTVHGVFEFKEGRSKKESGQEKIIFLRARVD